MVALLVMIVLGAEPYPDYAQQQREWFLARLIVDRNLSSGQTLAWEDKLSQMSPNQIDELVQAYQQNKERQARQNHYLQRRIYTDAVFNLKRMEAYRDYLEGQFQSQLRMRHQEIEQQQPLQFLPY